MVSKVNIEIIAARRTRMVRRFREDERTSPLVQETEKQGLRIEPVFLLNLGYIKGYSRCQALIEGYRCGIYQTNKIQTAGGYSNWTLFVTEKQLRILDFAVFIVGNSGRYRFFPTPAKEILECRPGRRRINVCLPLAGYKHQCQEPALDYFQFEGNWDQFRVLSDEKTAPAVPVLPVSSTPAS